MSTSAIDAALSYLKEHKTQFVDLRFTDTSGKEHHVTVPSHVMNQAFFTEGKMFDGSSIAGWKSIHQSDMQLVPDPDTLKPDPFSQERTVIFNCMVLDPANGKPYVRCPRGLAKRAEAYLKETQIADTAYFGPEPEFFIFDEVRFGSNISGSFYAIDAKEACWNSSTVYEEGNRGHRPSLKGGYFPVPPVDSSHNIRSAMCLMLEDMGLVVEAHHHEVATANQNEIATRYNTLMRKADELQTLKYVVMNVAHAFGKTATFLPKPLVGDNGSGMHVHQSLSKNGKNLFAGNEYAGLSELALYYIGGIMKHAKALNAFTNSTTNSYKRLVPGFEAPVNLAYSSCNRSAAIRIPHSPSASGRRIEVRFPDPATNPYFSFAAMLMAGLDGIQNKIHPGDPLNRDLFELTPEENAKIPQVCGSLSEALAALDADRAFLKKGDVFSDDLIDAYLELKQKEVTRFMMATHPIEFEMYYSL